MKLPPKDLYGGRPYKQSDAIVGVWSISVVDIAKGKVLGLINMLNLSRLYPGGANLKYIFHMNILHSKTKRVLACRHIT